MFACLGSVGARDGFKSKEGDARGITVHEAMCILTIQGCLEKTRFDATDWCGIPLAFFVIYEKPCLVVA